MKTLNPCVYSIMGGENILSLPGEIADYPSSTGAIDVQVVVNETDVGYATATVPVSQRAFYYFGGTMVISSSPSMASPPEVLPVSTA